PSPHGQRTGRDAERPDVRSHAERGNEEASSLSRRGAAISTLVRALHAVYHSCCDFVGFGKEWLSTMSIDKSLRRKNSLERSRNVLTRGERILQMQKEDRWPDGRSPYGLPKVKVIRLVVKKAKK